MVTSNFVFTWIDGPAAWSKIFLKAWYCILSISEIIPLFGIFFFLRLVLFIYLCCLFFYTVSNFYFILNLKQTFDTICNDYLADVETRKLLFLHLSSRWYTIFEIWTFIIQNNRSLIFMVSENASAKTDIPKFSTLKWKCLCLTEIHLFLIQFSWQPDSMWWFRNPCPFHLIDCQAFELDRLHLTVR